MMKKKAILMVWTSLAMVAASCLSAEVPRIIFDSDMYWDYDDVGALAILHTLADAGECEIVAVGSNTWGEGNKSVAACCGQTARSSRAR